MGSDGDNEFTGKDGEELSATDHSTMTPVPDLSTSQPGHNQSQTLEATALHLAVKDQDAAAIADLMKNGASPGALDADGLTPLHLCIVNKYIEPFKILLTYEGSADVVDASGLSVIYVAVLHVWREGVSAAVEAGARIPVEVRAFIPETDITQRYPQVMRSKLGQRFYKDTLIHLAERERETEITQRYPQVMMSKLGQIFYKDTLIHLAERERETEITQRYPQVMMSKLGQIFYKDTLIHLAERERETEITQRYPQVMMSKLGQIFYEDTLIHLAVKCGDTVLLDVIAAAMENTGTGIDCLNKKGVTALHTAIENCDLEAVRVLVKRGASVNKVSNVNDTALHVAVHHPHILKYLLEETDVEISNNDQGVAPIHLAVSINESQSVKLLLDIKPADIKTYFDDEDDKLHVQNHCRVLEDDERSNIELPSRKFRYPFLPVKTLTQIISLDADGYTPLHIAAKQRNMSMITLLLQKGAKLSTKGTKGKTALEIIATEFYNPSKCFELIFDDFISTEKVVSDTRVKVDYDALTTADGVSQMKVIEELVRCGQSKTLIHPLIESLLYLKWKHLLPVFYAMIGIYSTFLLSFNAFVVNLIHYRDKNNSSNASAPINSQMFRLELFDAWYWLLIILIYIPMTLLFLQELFYMYLRRFRYFLTLESWVKLSCLAFCAVVPIAESLPVQPQLHRHAASVALLLTWLQAMFLASRFPKWGYYVLMFGKVTINIFKILMTSICLVIGFSFCFMIEFRWAPPFDEPFAAFVKTVVMMSSEFDYEDLFGSEHASDLKGTKTAIRLIFMVFVVFVAIILMNFMIGVAVSDINDLQMSGSIKRLEKQVDLLSSLEVLVNNRLLAKLYNKRFGDKKYHKKISNYVGLQSQWSAALQYNYDVYYLDLPETLHAAIIDIAWKKEQRDEKNGIVLTNNYKLNALYDAVVDRPIVTSDVLSIDDGNKAKKPRECQSKLNIEIKSLKEGLSAVNNDVNNTMMRVNQISSDIKALKEMLASLAVAKSSLNLRTA